MTKDGLKNLRNRSAGCPHSKGNYKNLIWKNWRRICKYCEWCPCEDIAFIKNRKLYDKFLDIELRRLAENEKKYQKKHYVEIPSENWVIESMV